MAQDGKTFLSSYLRFAKLEYMNNYHPKENLLITKGEDHIKN